MTKKIGVSVEEAAGCAGLFAWVLEDVVKLNTPVPVCSPIRAATWVTLNEETALKVNAEAARSRRCSFPIST